MHPTSSILSRLALPSLLTALALCLVQAAEAEPIRAGCEFDYPPYCLVGADGQAGGFAVELLRASLAAMDRRATFAVGPWAGLKQDLADGRLQVLPLVARSPEREAVFEFTAPYLTMHGTIVVRSGTAGIRAMDDLRGRRVAVLQGDSAEEYVRRRPGLGAVVTPTRTCEEALRALQAGAQDAVVIQRLVFLQLCRQHGFKDLECVGPPLRDFVQNFCFAVREGDKELLALLNEGLAIVHADGTFRRLHDRWFAPPDRIGGLRRHLVVGGDSCNPPYEFLDRAGQPAGLTVELTRAIARQMGVEVEFRLGPWAETRRRLEAGELDLLQRINYSPERDRRLDFSPPYSHAQGVVVVRAGTPPPAAPADLGALASRTVLVREADILHEAALAAGLGPRLLLTVTQEEALRRLAAGEGDCALVARIPTLHLMREHGWNGLQVSAGAVLEQQVCFAVRQGDAEILAVFTEGLAAIERSGDYRRIRDRWLAPYDGPDLARILAYAGLAVGALLAVLLAMAAWSRTLRRRVALATAASQASEARYRALVDALPEMSILVFDRGKRYLVAGGGDLGRHGFAREGLLGRSLAEAFPPEVVALFDHRYDLALGGEASEFEHAFGDQHYHQQVVPIRDAAGAVSFGMVIARNITARTSAEEERDRLGRQLHQREKMDAIGQLAGGIAHDFNNQLSGVLGYADLLTSRLRDPDHLRYARNIAAAADRAADLTRKLLAFARRGKYLSVPTDLNRSVHEAVELLSRGIDKRIRIALRLEADPARVRGDPTQLQNLVLNLALNARDAMSQGGELAIATRLDPGPPAVVVLTVADTGVGMDSAVRQRLFEPFFTTKEQGKGTGLGLASVYGTVKSHDGTIQVDSAPGRGTTFTITLPALAAAAPEAAGPAAGPVPAGRGRILLVDDEAILLEVGGDLLRDLGYQVEVCADPDQALELYRRDWRSIDLVILDMVMPKLHGLDLFLAMQRSDPGIRALVSSGFGPGDEVQAALAAGALAFVQKPYVQAELARAVAAALAPR
jgi:PAS domain S-box-containing protein